MTDLAQNKPVRIIDTPVTKVVPTPREYTKSVNEVLKPKAPSASAPKPAVTAAVRPVKKPIPAKVIPRKDPDSALDPSPVLAPDDTVDMEPALFPTASELTAEQTRAPEQKMRYDAKKAQPFFNAPPKKLSTYTSEIDAHTVIQQNKAAIAAKNEAKIPSGVERVDESDGVKIPSNASIKPFIDKVDRPINEIGNVRLDDDIDPDAHHIFNNAIKQWNDLKKMSVEKPKPRVPEDVPFSTVPITKVDEATGNHSMYNFKDTEEMQKFLEGTDEGKALSKQHEVLPLTKEDGSLYLGRSADLEPGDNFSGRMTGPEASEIERLTVSKTGEPLIPSKVRGFTGSEDLTLAQMFPDYTVAKPTAIRNELKEALYPAIPQEVAVSEFLTKFADSAKVKQLEGDLAFTKMTETLTSLDSRLSDGKVEGMMSRISLSDDLKSTESEFKSIKSIVNDYNEEKSAIKQIMSCMIGGDE
jgi:hypothetical protein